MSLFLHKGSAEFDCMLLGSAAAAKAPPRPKHQMGSLMLQSMSQV